MTKNESKEQSRPSSTSYEEVLKNGVYTLSKPFKFEDGPEVVAIRLPLAKATGAEVIAAQDIFEVYGNQITGPVELNKKYQAFFAAHLAGVKPEFMLALPIKDFAAITLVCQRFLLSMGS